MPNTFFNHGFGPKFDDRPIDYQSVKLNESVRENSARLCWHLAELAFSPVGLARFR
jgi:hypothetical protein